MLFFKDRDSFGTSSEPESPIIQKELPPSPIPESDPPPYPIPSSSGPVRVNFLHLEEGKRTINDSWTVDPLLSIPPALMPPPPDDKTGDIPNLFLKNTHKPIIARLHLVSERPCRSRIVVRAQHKDATVTVVERQQQSFYLYVKSSHGQVKVALPRDFNGPITLNNTFSKPELSEGIKAAMTPFSAPPDTTKLFIGSWYRYGGADGLDKWLGDEVVLDGTHKAIKLFFADEVKA
ncbi:hypothetical protein M407DRAFT_19113 [Tulasnella calospora MUT 4182]|uniref:DUF7330 domain-containing protein n=1 Tax=Tulasnella calospora MUT 4182 TaxID=1051891 RepID=A0A0C3MDM9_9AGAM|nr:hypothetical protein M407DRAFT_19113 [Tulasnella calospora MUT 4182]